MATPWRVGERVEVLKRADHGMGAVVGWVAGVVTADRPLIIMSDDNTTRFVTYGYHVRRPGEKSEYEMDLERVKPPEPGEALNPMMESVAGGDL